MTSVTQSSFLAKTKIKLARPKSPGNSGNDKAKYIIECSFFSMKKAKMVNTTGPTPKIFSIILRMTLHLFLNTLPCITFLHAMTHDYSLNMVGNLYLAFIFIAVFYNSTVDEQIIGAKLRVAVTLFRRRFLP